MDIIVKRHAAVCDLRLSILTLDGADESRIDGGPRLRLVAGGHWGPDLCTRIIAVARAFRVLLQR